MRTSEVRVLSSVAVLYHPRRPHARTEAEWLAHALEVHQVRTTIGDGWDRDVIQRLCGHTDLAIALGGDGTILHVARLAARSQTPVVGVNLGRVGFLAEMTPETLHNQVDALVDGRFWIERRIMLDVEHEVDGFVETFVALNELALSRGGSPHAIRVEICLDGEKFQTYTADGLLVATATGSTAYSLAAGGPILYPESDDFLLTPIAPHLHIGRSTVVPGKTIVGLRLVGEGRGVLMADGADERAVEPGHKISVRRSDLVARFARFGPNHYFYSAIADRLK